MPIDINMETSLVIAEKLLDQEHILNTKRIEVLCQIILKMAESNPELKKMIENEIKVLTKLERRMEDLENTSRGILSPIDSQMTVFE